jgi:chromosome segregation ATPase
MQITKNRVIGALVALLLVSAVWGQKLAGQNKQLVRENEALQAQLKSGKDEAVSCSSLKTEISKERDARKQAAEQLNTAQEKLNGLNKEKAAAEKKAAELEAALTALQEEKENALKAAETVNNSLSAEQGQQQARLEDMERQIAQQQAVLEEQGQKLDSAAKVIEREQQLVKSCSERAAEQERAQDELEAAGQQLEEERNKVLAEAETLRAQVIGLEKIVEERSASLAKADKELENCKLNNEILIGQISQVKQEPVKKNTIPLLKSKAGQQTPAQQQPVPQQQLDRP